MFRRFRIKTALRGEVIGLRGGVDRGDLIRAELLFFEPAFHVAPVMRRERWTAEQAMVFMVTDVVRQAEADGALTAMARAEPSLYAALGAIYARVHAKAAADPVLAPCISEAVAGEPVRFHPVSE